MQGFPAVQITIRDYSVWRGGTLLLTACVVAALCGWAWQWLRVDTRVTWLALAVMVPAVGLAASLWRVVPVSLKFDGSNWLLWNPDRDGTEPIVADVEVCLDLGVWMLLRFSPAAETAGVRSRWLPVQRGAVGARWHALRCAVYSSRPARRVDAATDA
jgi:hypothetical protein